MLLKGLKYPQIGIANRRLYGQDFYQRIGRLGGKGDRGNAKDRGFATMDKAKHLEASRKGGTKSRRGKPLPK